MKEVTTTKKKILSISKRSFDRKVEILRLISKHGPLTYSEIRSRLEEKGIILSTGAIYNYLEELVSGGILEIESVRKMKCYKIKDLNFVNFILGEDLGSKAEVELLPVLDRNVYIKKGRSKDAFNKEDYLIDLLYSGLDIKKALEILSKVIISSGGEIKATELQKLTETFLEEQNPALKKRYFNITRAPLVIKKWGKEEVIGYDRLKNELISLGIEKKLAKNLTLEVLRSLKRVGVYYLDYQMILEFINSILESKGHSKQIILPKGIASRLDLARIFHCPYKIKEVERKIEVQNLPDDLFKLHKAGIIRVHGGRFWGKKPQVLRHDLRWFLKNGLYIPREEFISSLLGRGHIKPGKTLRSTLLQLAFIFERYQPELHGAQVVDLFNVFLAPYITKLNYKEIKDAINQFISILNERLYWVFSDLSFELSIPRFIEDEVVVMGGRRLDDRYGGYSEECDFLLNTFIDTISDYIKNEGKCIVPRMIFKIRDKKDLEKDVFYKIHNLMAKNPLPIYIQNLLDRKGQFNANYSSWFDEFSSKWKGWEGGTLRATLAQATTINLPRISLNKESAKPILERVIQGFTDFRKKFLDNLNQEKHPMLAQVNGLERYHKVENDAYAICVFGLNEAVLFQTGHRLHEKASVGEKILTDIKSSITEIIEDNSLSDLRVHFLPTPLYCEELRYVDTDKKKFKQLIPNCYMPETYTPGCYTDANLPLREKINVEKRFFRMFNGGLFYVDKISDQERKNPENLIKLSKLILRYPEIGLFTYKSKFAYY